MKKKNRNLNNKYCFNFVGFYITSDYINFTVFRFIVIEYRVVLS